MLPRRALDSASNIFSHPTRHPTLSICLTCRVTLTSTYTVSSTRSYRASAPNLKNHNPSGSSRLSSSRQPFGSSKPPNSKRPSGTQHEQRSTPAKEPRSLNSIRKAQRKGLWEKRNEEATAHYSPDDPFYQMSLARNEGGKRSRPKAKQPKARVPEAVEETDAEPVSSEAAEPVVSATELARGKASRSSLAPHDTIAFTATMDEQPVEDRHAIALANKFFQRNYSFLFSSPSIQYQPLNKDTPEVVVLGASNAGKSTFLNGLFGRRDAARVSSKAGHTKTINGHGIGHPVGGVTVEKGDKPPQHGLIVVDTPGYGYRSKKAWGDEIHRYLEKRDMLKGAILLIPQPKKMTDMDRWVLRLLASLNKRTLIIMTKADAAGKGWRINLTQSAKMIREECTKLSEELQSGWKKNDGWVPAIYATAAGWELRLGMDRAPGMAGARKAILEELAGVRIAERKVEAAPEHKAYDGDMVSWDSLMASEDGEESANSGEVDVEEPVVEESVVKAPVVKAPVVKRPVVEKPADITRLMRGRRRLR